jgi:hypothetical protein
MAEMIDSSQPTIYQIRIKSHLSPDWTDWFEGLTVTLEEDGDTLLSGPVVDQAALHGLLKKVRDLGLPLISVNCIESSQADSVNDKPHMQASDLKLSSSQEGPSDRPTSKEKSNDHCRNVNLK